MNPIQTKTIHPSREQRVPFPSYNQISPPSPLTHLLHASSYELSKSLTHLRVSKSALDQRLSYRIFLNSTNLAFPIPRPCESYTRSFPSLIAVCSYSSSLPAINSFAALFPASFFGSALVRILAAMRLHILYLYRGSVNRGVPLHNTSAAVVCALHSGVSRKRSQTRAREMCWCLGATSVKTMREAMDSPAQSVAMRFRFCSPRSGKRRSQRMARGMRARMRSQVRKVVGSI